MKQKPKKPWYEFRAQADQTTAELRIFGPIGGGWFFDEDAITGKGIAEQLEQLPDDVKAIRVLINTVGGSVFDAIHIANALRRQREEKGRAVNIEIEALAASAGTIITSAGTSVKMPRNALLMVHMPIGFADGPRSTMIKVAEALERAARAIIATYKWISPLKSKELRALMEATTWMDADEALANGFVTEVAPPIQAAAAFSPEAIEQLENVPEKYRDQIQALCNVSDQDDDDDEADAGEEDDDDGDGDELDDQDEDEDDDDDGAEEEDDDDGDDDDGEEDDDEAGDDDDDEEDAGNNQNSARPARAGGQRNMKPKPKNDDEKAAIAAEKARNVGINAAADVAIRAGLDEKTVRAAATTAIADDTSADGFRTAMFDQLADKSNATGPKPGAGHTGIEAGEDVRDKRRTGIAAALWTRAGVADTIRAAAAKRPNHPAFQNIEFDPGEFRGMSLFDFARDSVELGRPGASRGRTRMDVAGLFLNASGGQQTTSDFAVALENALHKTLLAAYAIQPDTWRLFCKIGSVADFRPHPKYQRGFLSRLEKVLESGEFKNQTIPDAAKEIQQAATYGNILQLSRQAIINDDMGVFDDLAMMLGRAAGLSLELGVFDLLKLNGGLGPNMNDGNPLYDASHSNIGTGSALTVAGIDADRVVMATQTDSSGNEFLDLRPAILVLPVGLGGEARVINESQYDNDGSKFQKPNKVVGLFRDIADTPQLSGTRRYLFADPNIAPTIEVAFLDGEQEPVMEMQDGWRVDGVEWKVRHDFGIAAIDFRGTVTNAGA